MFSQRKMLYSLGDQKIFIFPLEKKPARGRTERNNHGDCYTHLKPLGIIIMSNLPNK